MRHSKMTTMATQKRSKMKKLFKRKDSSVSEQGEQDIAGMINKIQEQLVSLERKIDSLVSKSSTRPSEKKDFSKHFQRFDSSRHQGRGDRDNSFRERNFTKVICSDCNKECEVPFKPSGDRPVYCKECFSKRKGRSLAKESYNNKPREQVFIKGRSFDRQKNSENQKSGKRKQQDFKKRKKRA